MTHPTRHVVVLHGVVAKDPLPNEQAMLIEVQAVAEVLERLGYTAEPLAFTLDLEAVRTRLTHRRPLLVFNLVKSVARSGCLMGMAPALLEELGLPYTGAALAGMFFSSNKRIAKRLFEMGGIATPYGWMPESQGQDLAALGPWIVKSVWENASIGLDNGSLVREAKLLQDIIRKRSLFFDSPWYAESYIDGREFNLCLLAGPEGFEVLPPVETRFEDFPVDKPKILGYQAKWDADSFEHHHIVRTFTFSKTDVPLLAMLKALALDCAALLELRGYAQIDVRVDGAGKSWVLEVNANPCLAPGMDYIAAARQAGLIFDHVIGQIVEDALLR